MWLISCFWSEIEDNLSRYEITSQMFPVMKVIPEEELSPLSSCGCPPQLLFPPQGLFPVRTSSTTASNTAHTFFNLFALPLRAFWCVCTAGFRDKPDSHFYTVSSARLIAKIRSLTAGQNDTRHSLWLVFWCKLHCIPPFYASQRATMSYILELSGQTECLWLQGIRSQSPALLLKNKCSKWWSKGALTWRIQQKSYVPSLCRLHSSELGGKVTDLDQSLGREEVFDPTCSLLSVPLNILSWNEQTQPSLSESNSELLEVLGFAPLHLEMVRHVRL